MKWLVNYDASANEECNGESTSQYHSPIKLKLKDVTEMIEPLPKDCKRCSTLLNSRCDLVVASPFFILYGNALETEMDRYPDNIKITFEGKELGYKKGYGGLKYPIINESTYRYSSYFKSNDNFWYRFEPLNFTPIRRVLTFQDDMVLGRIYMCNLHV